MPPCPHALLPQSQQRLATARGRTERSKMVRLRTPTCRLSRACWPTLPEAFGGQLQQPNTIWLSGLRRRFAVTHAGPLNSSQSWHQTSITQPITFRGHKPNFDCQSGLVVPTPGWTRPVSNLPGLALRATCNSGLRRGTLGFNHYQPRSPPQAHRARSISPTDSLPATTPLGHIATPLKLD